MSSSSVSLFSEVYLKLYLYSTRPFCLYCCTVLFEWLMYSLHVVYLCTVVMSTVVCCVL